jgi:hypothetical protein
MLRWADRELRLAGIRGLRRANVRIGTEGFVVAAGSPPVEVYVYWRYGVVWAALGGRGIGEEKALALARVQQGRIRAALG